MSRKTILFVFISTMLLGMGVIDLDNLYNYENQPVPGYINVDNTGNNYISDEVATLGRVLFYDKSLSSNYSTSCASCHLQEFAFGDTAILSVGANGITGRHAMRLVNARFSDEDRFFWDERAKSLEDQVTQPIQDHGEMGFSGTNGDPNILDLFARLDTLDRYQNLFTLAFGDPQVNDYRLKIALAQFVRSIQSFDSKYDQGRAQVNFDSVPFPNFTFNENVGKQLFMDHAVFDSLGVRIAGGLGCHSCHRAPDFGMAHSSQSNGVVLAQGQLPGPGAILDTLNTKSPSLRDMFNPNGQLNGPLMHTGDFPDFSSALQHYANPPQPSTLGPLLPFVDQRLYPNGFAQQLNVTPLEEQQITEFMKTLTGTNVYTDPRWSDPFDLNGDLTLTGSSVSISEIAEETLEVYPNPAQEFIYISGIKNLESVEIINGNGKTVLTKRGASNIIKLNELPAGIYYLRANRINALPIHEKLVIQ